MIKVLVAAIITLLLFSIGVLMIFPQISITKDISDKISENEELKIEEDDSDILDTLETYNNPPSGAKTQRIFAKEAKLLMDSADVLILDVRTPEEYEQGHIRGAVLIPLDELKQRAPYELKDKWKIILVYCRSGNRSALASDILADMLYMNVFDFGGINNWPYEVVQ